MEDQPAQADYAAYETDPLFGALPGGYDAQQHGSEQYQYGAGQYPEQQHTYAGTTGEWDGGTAGSYTPTPAPRAPGHQAPGPSAQPYDWAPAPEFQHEHGYAYPAAATAVGPTPTLVHGVQVQDPYGYYQQHESAAPGYEPTMQWTVPAEVLVDPQDQQTQIHLQVQVPPAAHVHHQQGGHHSGQGHGQAQPEPEPAPAPAPYDAGWYASQDTVIAQLVVPLAEPDQHQHPRQDPAQDGAAGHDGHAHPDAAPVGSPAADPDAGPGGEPEAEYGADPVAEPGEPVAEPAPQSRVTRAGTRTTARAAGSGSRRRAPAKRSALLTIAVPSACVMGVAGIAAASMNAVGGGDDKQDDTTTTAAADPASVKPVAANDKMDTQLAALSADARDFGDRASRTQERIDLKERQAADKKKRDQEAARKEAARPKYLLPVKQRGLSAYFGQAGVNWMSVHTGIDFPVMTGTPVMAVTDGTVRTKWNPSYGNMAIVTAPDGTETWYCHLSSTRVRSGSVKAGDVIAYSGNTGNTTGPHLHFEVRPGGGAAIDPLPWLRSHGLDPT
ncbi:peptidoglycan DD-metalloendopeptidase family protein [Streptomyces sp. NBC_01497]|uniref:peptidoglycan DD-metalloendopeptidase family protein n=1 Tax=Streptomyces sp. NBC_01497 TaxID=2903885 RepID=UPI002E322C4D|nr:peptidoglycan DD-metalloendopeptidase family protein [Streptomyces sp. NBC_01497]